MFPNAATRAAIERRICEHYIRRKAAEVVKISADVV